MEVSTEEWRPVLGYEGFYEVSDRGRVRSIDRKINVVEHSRRYRRKRRGCMLCFGASRGRPIVSLNRSGKRTFFVHRLVLEAFVGHCPEGLECCHKDGDKTNNRRGNLRWDTKASNIADRERHGTTARGERGGMAKLTERDVREIRRRYAVGGVTKTALGLKYGVSGTNVTDVINRRTWAHVD